MKRNLLLGIFSAVLAVTLVALAQDTGGEMDMTGGMSDSMTGGDMSMADTSSMTVAEVVASNPDFGILAQLVQSAGLLETLGGEGPFTVFAPSDSAFLPFTNNQIVSLVGDSEALTNVLTYHVVDGELSSEDLANMSSVTTLQGGELTVGEGMTSDMSSSATGGEMTGGMMEGDMSDDMSMTGGAMSGDMTGGAASGMSGITVGSANVVAADIQTANGVIHVIDTVLMPGN